MSEPTWACRNCGHSGMGFHTVQHPAGDYDVECVECGSDETGEASDILRTLVLELDTAVADRDAWKARAERAEAEAHEADKQLRCILVWAGSFGGYTPGHLKHSAQGAWDRISRLQTALSDSERARQVVEQKYEREKNAHAGTAGSHARLVVALEDSEDRITRIGAATLELEGVRKKAAKAAAEEAMKLLHERDEATRRAAELEGVVRECSSILRGLEHDEDCPRLAFTTSEDICDCYMQHVAAALASAAAVLGGDP